MRLETLLQAGNVRAKQLIKSMLDNPMIVSTLPPWAISLEVTSHSKKSVAEVSQYPVIVPGTGVKQFLSDNVAPQPKEWNLSGYIPGEPLIEVSNYFTPIVELNTVLLWAAYENGQRIIFKDMDNIPYLNCVISSLDTHYEKDCKNKRPFTMTIKEIKTIEMGKALLTTTENAASAAAGTAGGAAADMGTTAASSASDNSNLWNFFSKMTGL